MLVITTSQHKQQGESVQHQSIPESFDSVLQEFISCFTKPSFRSFTDLLVGWVLCRDRRWITRVFLAMDPRCRKHPASYYRFFSKSVWLPDRVGKCLFRLLLPRLPEAVEAMVDDTLCRRSGPRIFGISMHHDGSSAAYSKPGQSAIACGHSWVVLAIRLPVPWASAGLAIPILLRLYRSPKRSSKAEYRKRTELAREMLEILAGWIPEERSLHLTGDREYACKTLLRGLSDKVEFTGPMPMDAMLSGPTPKYQGRGRPRLRGRDLLNPRRHIARYKSEWRKVRVPLYRREVTLLLQNWTCLWYTATGQRLVRVVVTRDPKGNYADRAFFSTDHELPAPAILQLYAHRWLIEVNFRDAKQMFGLTDPQNGWSRGVKRSKKQPGPRPRGFRGRRAVERTAPFAWFAYGIVVIWYLNESRWQKDVAKRAKECPWYKSKTNPSFEDMLKATQVEFLAHRLLSRPLKTATLANTRRILSMVGMAA